MLSAALSIGVLLALLGSGAAGTAPQGCGECQPSCGDTGGGTGGKAHQGGRGVSGNIPASARSLSPQTSRPRSSPGCCRSWRDR